MGVRLKVILFIILSMLSPQQADKARKANFMTINYVTFPVKYLDKYLESNKKERCLTCGDYCNVVFISRDKNGKITEEHL